MYEQDVEFPLSITTRRVDTCASRQTKIIMPKKKRSSQKTRVKSSTSTRGDRSLTQLTVAGYKSIAKATSINLAPITVLAGPNAAGKSSTFQPLLLLKQTLDVEYDPGPLLIDGPNVRFSSFDQLFSQAPGKKQLATLKIGLSNASDSLTVTFKRSDNKRIIVDNIAFGRESGHNTFVLRQKLSTEEIEDQLPPELKNFISSVRSTFAKHSNSGPLHFSLERDRFLFNVVLGTDDGLTLPALELNDALTYALRRIIHIPGFRGTPERTYQRTSTGPLYPGTFEQYTASIINRYAESSDKPEHAEFLRGLSNDLIRLGLTWKVTAEAVGDTRIQVRVGRSLRAPQGGAHDLVNIADTGFGVSQVLPLLVALRVADVGQLVIVEQPELHLHPRAQMELGRILAERCRNGPQIILETHSSVLIRSLQTCIANKTLNADDVNLTWVSRNSDGFTETKLATLDSQGRYNDWPADFADVELESERAYLDAVSQSLFE